MEKSIMQNSRTIYENGPVPLMPPDYTMPMFPPNFENVADLPFETCDDPHSTDALSFLIEDLIPKNSLTLLYGQATVEKTLAGLHMAVAMASGIPWMGLKTMQGIDGNICVFSPDMNQNNLKHLLDRVISGYEADQGLSRSELHRLMRITEQSFIRVRKPPVNFYSGSSVDVLEEFVRKNNIRLLLITSLMRAIPGADIFDADDMICAFTRIRELMYRAIFSTLFLHHPDRSGKKHLGSRVIGIEANTVISFKGVKNSRDRFTLTVEKSRYSDLRTLALRSWQDDSIGPDGQARLDTLGHPLQSYHLQKVTDTKHDAALTGKASASVRI